MKRSFQNLLLFIGFLILSGTAIRANASHLQGAELTYTCVAPGTYIVNLKQYRDCTGIAASTTATLNLKSPGCNTGRNLAMTRFGTNKIGDLYCPQLGPPVCTATGNPNFEEVIFTATVTFTAAEAQCADWILSWSECCRPEAANIQNAQSFTFYTEAYLNLGTPATSSFNNSSPNFQTMVVSYINKYQPIILSSNAVDPDGDSLVYSLVNPMNNATTPITSYALINYNANWIINPNDSTQMAQHFGTLPTNYSPTFPMVSFMVDWHQPAPRQAVPSFTLDPNHGSLVFTPSVYHPGTSSAQGRNKYVVVVQVDEYRKVAGVAVKVGAVRRDMFITVIDCGPNQNPEVTAPVANGQPLAPGSIINLRPGTPLTLTFASNDNNTNDIVTMESNAGSVLPGAVFLQTAGNKPTGTLTWIPTAAHVRDQIYYFIVTVQDDACPVKGQRVETFGVRVSATGGVTGISKALTAQPAFTAYPNPFSEVVTFKVRQTQPHQQILIYNVLGKQVDQIQLKGHVHTEQLVNWTNAAKFPAGQYVARFSGNAGSGLKISKLQ